MSSSPPSASSVSTPLASSVVLPVSKRTLPNRLVKAAMTECFANPNTAMPNDLHVGLYKRWSDETGCGMLITGNVMVKRNCRESPRNVVLDDDSANKIKHGDDRGQAFQKWAQAIQSEGALAIMQLSHPGRQSSVAVTGLVGPCAPVAPSKKSGKFKLPGLLGAAIGATLVRKPREITVPEIQDVIRAFARSAKLAEQAGFAGVQIHAAHGYLLSQFLSEKVNCRTDEYGGTAEKRQRLLFQVIAAVREATSQSFVVGIKINSRDDRQTAEQLDLILKLCSPQYKLDFIEISGGSYEDPLLVQHVNVDKVGTSDEGFFLSFAKRLQAERGGSKATSTTGPKQEKEKASAASSPSPLILLTGGFRSRRCMESVLESGVTDLVGLGRPLVMQPTFARDLLQGAGAADVAESYNLSVGVADAILSPALNNLWYQQQMMRLAQGKDPDPNLGFCWTLTGKFGASYIWDPTWTTAGSTTWSLLSFVVLGVALLIAPF